MKVDNKHTFGFIPEKKTKKGNSKPDNKQATAQSEDKQPTVEPAQTPDGDAQGEESKTE